MATSPIFGNPLKIGQDSCHTSKGRQIPSSTKRERALEAQHKLHFMPSHRKEPSTGPVHAKASPWWVVERRLGGGFTLHLRPGIDRLETSLGIYKSLAFRAFDETIIFGHWLLKTRKLALASRAFLLEKASTIS